MKKFTVKITKQDKVQCELFGNSRDLAIAIVQLMQENSVVCELITASSEAFKELEKERLANLEIKE